MPNTCFIFTCPLLKALKDKGQVLHRRINPEYTAFLVKLVCYSFENDESVFNEFLSIIRDLSKVGYNKSIELEVLLNRITEEEIKKNAQYF